MTSQFDRAVVRCGRRTIRPGPWRLLAGVLLLSGCGNPTACLYNPYDTAQPQRSCTTGLQLPGGVLKDTDPP